MCRSSQLKSERRSVFIERFKRRLLWAPPFQSWTRHWTEANLTKFPPAQSGPARLNEIPPPSSSPRCVCPPPATRSPFEASDDDSAHRATPHYRRGLQSSYTPSTPLCVSSQTKPATHSGNLTVTHSQRAQRHGCDRHKR